jgi:hypothetical protein
MQPSRPPSWIAAAIGLVASFAHPASAHVISIIRGTAVVHAERLEVVLEVNPEDLVHYYGSGEITPRAADRHAEHLLEQFVIRDADGDRVMGRVASVRTATSDKSAPRRFVYSLEYALASAPEYLTFQQRIGAVDAGLRSQLYLLVRTAGASVTTILRLTSGGNTETLQLQWPDNGSIGARPGIAGPVEELKSVRVRMDVREDGVNLQVDVPFPIMETFLPLRRDRQDFLETGEQEAARLAIQRFLDRRFPLRINGQSAEPHDSAIAFVQLNPAGRAQRLSAWTTRVRAHLSYPSPELVREVEMGWTLFNAAVLEVQAVVNCNGQETDRRISTYEPDLRWVRTR